MRHGILGPGGIGGLLGAVLANAGDDVTVIVRPGTEASYPREMSLESPFGSFRAPVSVVEKAEQPLDVLWLAVKATQLGTWLDSIHGDLPVDVVVPLLNGLDHVEQLRKRFGKERVVPATIAVESERTAPGRIVQRSPFVRLHVASSGQNRLTPVMEIFRRFGFETRFVDNESTLLWSKLVFLAPIALSTAAGRCTIGEVLRDPSRAARLEKCLREACNVASVSGAEVEADATLAKIKALPPAMRSSMEKDLTNGNVLELDAIAGPIVRGAKTHGIAVDATSELASEVKELSVELLRRVDP
jgi:2-dehydropantoate 2-reductase